MLNNRPLANLLHTSNLGATSFLESMMINADPKLIELIEKDEAGEKSLSSIAKGRILLFSTFKDFNFTIKEVSNLTGIKQKELLELFQKNNIEVTQNKGGSQVAGKKLLNLFCELELNLLQQKYSN